MEGKLQELTEKIYQEGVEKGKAEANAIIEKAKKEANEIILKAESEARGIIEQAKKEAEQLKNKTLSEIKMSSEQAITVLKQEIESLLLKASLSNGVKEAVNDAEFIKNVVKELVSSWKNTEAVLTLPENRKKELEDFFKTKASDLLNKGLTLKFESRFSGGFKIGPKDNSFTISFTENDLIEFFQSFLRAKTKEILFPGA